MDNVVSNMMAATCEGTIMDNIPIIMTLGTPTAPYLGCKKPLARDATPAYSSRTLTAMVLRSRYSSKPSKYSLEVSNLQLKQNRLSLFR